MIVYEFGKKKPHLRSPNMLGYIPMRGWIALGVRRLTFSHLGQHQTHPGDLGCNMNREVNLWHPENLERKTS